MKSKKILVRSPNWIGDQILAYPFFYYLRRAYPTATIGVACVPWVQSIQFKNLINQVFVLPKAAQPTLLSKWEAIEEGAKKIRAAGPWDLGFCLPNSFSSAWLLFRSQVKERRGYNADGRRLLLTKALPWSADHSEHRAESYVHLLPKEYQPSRPVLEFWGVPPPNDLDPGTPGEEEYFNAEKSWNDPETLEPPSGGYWVLAPGSTAESRRWPLDKFAALARQIWNESKTPGIIVGGAAETEVAMRLSEDPTLHLSDWTGRGAVTCYSKVFRQAKFSVCNDSGLAHVASLCGSLVQIVWGAGDPKRTEPIGPGQARMIFNPVECWPCERNTCSQPLDGKLACLRGIDSEEVWKEIKSGIRPQ